MLQRFVKNTTGSLAVFAALAIPAITVGVGAAVDMSHYMNTKAKFAQVVDNSLLSAAASSQTQDVDKVANQFFYANYTAPERAKLSDVTIDVTKDSGVGAFGTWTITASATMRTSFGKILGVKTLALRHTAQVQLDTSKQAEVVFMADTSASMCMTTEHSVKGTDGTVMKYTPDPRCSKLNALKESLIYVVKNGFAPLQASGGPAFKVGVVPFNHKVKFPNLANIPEPLTYIETTSAKGAANYYTNFDDANPLAPIIPLRGLTSSADQDAIVAQIDAITQKPEGMGWTRSNIATLTAAMMLDPAYNASFGGTRPNVFDPKKTEKVVVMMTDGANIGCCYAAWPEGNYNNQYLYLYEADNAHLVGLDNAPKMRKWATQYNIPSKGICDQLKEHGVTVYSVIFDVDDNDPGGQDIKNAYRQCASNEQFFFDVGNGDELKLAYKTIAQSFIRLRLTK